MALGYVWEKFHVAMMNLAGSDAPIRVRLAGAYANALIRLKREAFATPDSKRRYDALIKITDRVPPTGEEGSIVASLNALSDDECVALAKEIVSLADGLSQEYALQMGKSLLERQDSFTQSTIFSISSSEMASFLRSYNLVALGDS